MPPGEQRVIVQDVTFAVEAGTGVGVIGPSGSGKSSSAPSGPIAEIRPVGDQPVTRSPRRRARHAQTRQRSNTANYVKHAERHGRLPTSRDGSLDFGCLSREQRQKRSRTLGCAFGYSPDWMALSSRKRIAPSLLVSEITKRARP